MKKLIPILLPCFVFINSCFAQQRMEYAKFVKNDTSVKWAAICNSYVNLTPANAKLSIRDFYINKLKKQGATTYIEDSTTFIFYEAAPMVIFTKRNLERGMANQRMFFDRDFNIIPKYSFIEKSSAGIHFSHIKKLRNVFLLLTFILSLHYPGRFL